MEELYSDLRCQADTRLVSSLKSVKTVETKLYKHLITMDNAIGRRPWSTEADSSGDLHETQDDQGRSATPPSNALPVFPESRLSENTSYEFRPWLASRRNALIPREYSPEERLSAYFRHSTSTDEIIPLAEAGHNILPTLGSAPGYSPGPDIVLPSIDELLAATPTPAHSTGISTITLPAPIPPEHGYGITDVLTGRRLPRVTPSTPILTHIHATHGSVVRGPSPDITPAPDPFADSGYAPSNGGPLDQLKARTSRASHEEVINNEGVSSRVTVAEDALRKLGNADEAEDSSSVVDNTSVYTSNSSVTSEARDAYSEALVDELLESLLDCLTGPENVEEVSEEISESLPELLKDFSLSIGYQPPSQMHLDVMVFIRKYRQ